MKHRYVIGLLMAAGLISAQALAVTRADSLLAVDQNRVEIINGLVEKWKDHLNNGKEGDLRKTLQSLRADKLLALSLAQDQKQFAALLEKDDFLPVVEPGERLSAGAQAKALGDATQDVVYRPVNPCRVFDTRPASQLVAGVARAFATQGGLAGQGGAAAGCGIPAGATAIILQLTNEFPPGAGFLIGGAQGTAGGGIMVYAAGSQITVSATIPLNTANGQFALLANNANTQLIGDAVGYFMPVTSGNITASVASGTVFTATNTNTAGGSTALRGVSTSTTSGGIGVVGSHAGSGWGVLGQANSATSTAGRGVFGSSSAEGVGVYGQAANGGNGYAVFSDGRLGVANSSVLDFGSQVRQMVQLWGGPNSYGIGVQAGTQYYRLDTSTETDPGGFAWYRGGVHSDTTFDPGAGGATIMRLTRGGSLDFPDTTAPGQQITMRTVGSGIGAQTNTAYMRTNTAIAFFQGGVHSQSQVDPGTGGAILATIHTGGVGGASVVTGTVRAQAYQTTSDRNAKTAFSKVDAKSVLAKVAALPISSWMYKNEQGLGVRHLGPVAQDFKRAFNVGSDDKTISTVDADGVALAAIQGLHQIVKEKDAEIATLKREMEVIKKKLGL